MSVLTLIDTAGCGMEEAAAEDSDSKHNEGEARVTLSHAQLLIDGGVRPEDIGIITPYNAQVTALRYLCSGNYNKCIRFHRRSSRIACGGCKAVPQMAAHFGPAFAMGYKI